MSYSRIFLRPLFVDSVNLSLISISQDLSQYILLVRKASHDHSYISPPLGKKF